MLSLLALLAVLAMPFGMATETAAAATAHHEARAASASGHCDDSPQSGLPTGLADCGMACAAALPALGPTPDDPTLAPCTPEARARAQALTGLPPETATPPPKRS